jgi:hypothetical protein
MADFGAYGPALTIGSRNTFIRLDRVEASHDGHFWRVEGRHPHLRADFVVHISERDIDRFLETLLAGIDAGAARRVSVTEDDESPVALSLFRLGGADPDGNDESVVALAMLNPGGAGTTTYLTMELAPQPVDEFAAAIRDFRKALR